MKIRAILFSLLFASAGYAADGDSAIGLQGKGDNPGQYRESCFYLCHEKDSGDSTCSEFDFAAHGGIPSKATVEIHAATGCSAAYSVDVNQGWVSGGPEHDVATLTSSTTLADTGSTITVRRFWNTDLSTMTGCTADSFHVVICAYHEL